MMPKEILSCLFNSFEDIRIVSGNLFLVATDMCGKNLCGGVDKWVYVKTYTFNNFVEF